MVSFHSRKGVIDLRNCGFCGKDVDDGGVCNCNAMQALKSMIKSVGAVNLEKIIRENKAAVADYEKHFQNPFYIRVQENADEIRINQIKYGAEKYPETFNPDSWSGQELYYHLMQELADAQVYGTGLLDRIEKQERTIRYLMDKMRLISEASELASKEQLQAKAAQALATVRERKGYFVDVRV